MTSTLLAKSLQPFLDKLSREIEGDSALNNGKLKIFKGFGTGFGPKISEFVSLILEFYDMNFINKRTRTVDANINTFTK